MKYYRLKPFYSVQLVKKYSIKGGIEKDRVTIHNSSFPTPIIPPIRTARVFGPIWKDEDVPSTCSSSVTTSPD